jgi:hypothetical protein
MAKFRNPISFSRHFEIDRQILAKGGAMDPLLNVDTKLFIDPLLLDASAQKEVSNSSMGRLREYFERVLKVLDASRQRGDAAWREADRLMHFPELQATCLGYGAASAQGSGFGTVKRAKVLATAKEIIDLGVDDPDLFLLIPLLEESIGPDLISDMTTRIILPDLARFTERVLGGLSIPRASFRIGEGQLQLPQNPFFNRRTPVILVPADVLSRLPVVTDWSEVADAAAQNTALRGRVNNLIGDIWNAKVRRDKARLRAAVLRRKEAVDTLLEAVKGSSREPYDFHHDPLGIRAWRNVLETIADQVPLQISKPQQWDADAVFTVVRKIAAHFGFLIVQKGLNKILWHDGKPQREEVAQRVFFAVAHAYCAANNLDITPEADTGSGEVDFKFSAGFSTRVVVETKLSNNPKVVHGYEKQLEIYKNAEQTSRGLYLVIDVGGMGRKDRALIELRNERTRNGESASDLLFVNGLLQPSASKR